MQDQEMIWARFHSDLPDETLYPEESRQSAAIKLLISWPAGIFASWHYWLYLQTDNPLHGLHASVILRNYPISASKKLLAESAVKVWRDASNLGARKNSFMKASNEILTLFAIQQLNILCSKPLTDCYVRLAAKSDALQRPFRRAPTLKQAYNHNKTTNPVFQMTQRVLQDLVKQKRVTISEATIDAYLAELPTTEKIGIVGSLYD